MLLSVTYRSNSCAKFVEIKSGSASAARDILSEALEKSADVESVHNVQRRLQEQLDRLANAASKGEEITAALKAKLQQFATEDKKRNEHGEGCI